MLVFGLPNGRRETTVSSTALLLVTKRQKTVAQTIVPAAFPLPRRTWHARLRRPAPAAAPVRSRKRASCRRAAYPQASRQAASCQARAWSLWSVERPPGLRHRLQPALARLSGDRLCARAGG